MITMYELLGMVKDGKAPNKIKYDNMIWEYDGDYYYSEDNVFLEEYCNLTTSLNDKVEILEEEKKIPEKIEEREIEISMAIGEQICANKINEIIDYLQYIKSKGE